MPRGGKRSTSFKPGQKSPNPKGRPKKPANELATVIAKQAIQDVKAAAKECTTDAISALKSIVKDSSKPAAARVSAATVILDRGWGKAPVTIAGDSENPVEHRVTFTTDERVAAIRALLAKARA
jgi:hypothetical protein